MYLTISEAHRRLEQLLVGLRLWNTYKWRLCVLLFQDDSDDEATKEALAAYHAKKAKSKCLVAISCVC